MKYKINNYIKLIFMFLILFTMFFVGSDEFKAADPYCMYSTSDGKYKVKVTLSQDTITSAYINYWKANAQYLTWNGTDVSSPKHENTITTFVSKYWDLWIYKENTCPPYLLGAYKEVAVLGDKHWAPHFSHSTSLTYNGEAKSYEKILTYDSQNSSFNISAFDAPRRFNNFSSNGMWPSIAYTYSQGTTFNSSTAGSSNTTSQITLESGDIITIYAKGYNDYLGNNMSTSIDFRNTTITCSSSLSSAVSIKTQPKYWYPADDNDSSTNENYAVPGFYFTIEAKQVTSVSSGAIVNCSVSYSDGKNTINEEANNLYVHVTESSTPQQSYDSKDITCQYMLRYKNDSGAYDISDVKITSKNFNDNQTTKENIEVTFFYKNIGNNFVSTINNSAVVKNTKITDYQYSNNSVNSGKNLKFKFSFQDYANALKYDNGACPALYVKKNGSTYEVYLTSSSDDYYKAYTKSKETKDSNNKTTIETYDETTDKTFSIPVYFYSAEKVDNTTTPYLKGAITFKKEGTLTKYYMQISNKDNTEVSQKLTEYTLYDTTQQLEVYTGTGASSFYSYEYYVRVAPSILKEVEKVLNGTLTEEEFENNGYNTLTDRVLNTGYAYKEYYTISLEAIVAEGNDFNQSSEINRNESFSGTTANDGYSDYVLTAGSTDELEIFVGDNEEEIKCEDLFGYEGNRNSLYDVIHTVRLAIQIGTPILLILLTMLDFTKATTNDEALPKAKKNAVTRAIIAIIIFLVPSILNIILDIIGFGNCGI